MSDLENEKNGCNAVKVTLALTLSMQDMEPTRHEYAAEVSERGGITRVSFWPGGGDGHDGDAESAGKPSAPLEHLDFFRDEAGKLIKIRRSGASGTMVFQLWESLPGMVNTIAGAYDVKTYANRMEESRGEGCWTVDLRYRLCIGLVDRGVCEMRMEIKN